MWTGCFPQRSTRLGRHFKPDQVLSTFISPLLNEPVDLEVQTAEGLEASTRTGKFSILQHRGIGLSKRFSVNLPKSNQFVIFHRNCYDDLFPLLQAVTSRPDLRKGVITGTPGIGKSHSFFSFSRKFLLERHSLPDGTEGGYTRRIIGYERRYQQSFSFYELSEDGNSILAYDNLGLTPGKNEILRGLLRKRDIIFRDTEGKRSEDYDDLNCAAFEILISSPRRPCFTTFLKHVDSAARFVLPSFNCNELRLFGAGLNYDPVRIEDACILYEIFAGVPRYCYEMAYLADQWKWFFNLFFSRQLTAIMALNECRRPTFDHLKSSVSDQSFPHRLLFIQAADRTFKLHRFSFPSKFISELAMFAHQFKEKTFALNLLTQKEYAKTQWKIFEYSCLLMLTSNLPALPMKAAEFDSSGAHTNWKTIQSAIFALPHRNVIEYRNHIDDHVSCNEQVLIVPTQQPNNPTWDALSTHGLFKFVTKNTHSFKPAGLEIGRAILKAPEHEKVNFFWMVPQTNFDTGNFTITQNDPQVLQMANHYLIPRPDPTPRSLDRIRTHLILNKFESFLNEKELSSPLKGVLCTIVGLYRPN